MDEKMIDAVEQTVRFVSRNGLVHPRALAEAAVMTMISVQSMTEAPPDELMFTASESIDQIETSIDMERDRALVAVIEAWRILCQCGETTQCRICGTMEDLYGKILNDPEFEGVSLEFLG
jgi:hypothetical protein